MCGDTLAASTKSESFSRPSERKKIVADSVLMLAANAIASAIAFIRGFYIAHMLAPAEFGLWSLAAAAFNYANYADLGLNNGLLLEAGKLSGQKRAIEAEHLLRQGYTATIVLTGGVGAIAAILSYVAFPNGSDLAAVIRTTGVSALILGIANFYQMRGRIGHYFARISVATVVSAVVALAGTFVIAAGSYRARVVGLVVASAAGGMGATFCLLTTVPCRPQWPLRWTEVAPALKLGVPLTIVPVLFTIFQSIDRWLVARVVSGSDLGYYGFGVAIGMSLNMVPNTLAVVLYTRFIERFGATGNARSAEPLLLPPLFAIGYIMALVGGSLVTVLPYVIQYIVPAYAGSNRLVYLHVVANCFLCVVPVITNFMLSINRKSRVIGSLIIATGMKIVLVSSLCRVFGITAAAWGVVVADIGYAAFLAHAILSDVYQGRLLRTRKMAELFLPLALCLPIPLALSRPATTGHLVPDLGSFMKTEMAFAVIASIICAALAYISGIFRPYARAWGGSKVANP